MLADYEARIEALECLVDKLALENEFLKEVSRYARQARSANTSVIAGPAGLSVAEGCRLMGLARSTFYDELEVQLVDEARLVERIREVCAEWPAYGYRRVAAELHGEGHIVNHKKVMRLMKENGLTVRSRRRFVVTTDSNHDGPIFPNLAESIVPTDLNQLWVADITYIAIATGFVYLAAILDACHGELSTMRSASGSMYVWRLPHCAPPSRHVEDDSVPGRDSNNAIAQTGNSCQTWLSEYGQTAEIWAKTACEPS
jgi:hypothetical protein